MSIVLIVEDEMNLALMAEDLLVLAGYSVIKASRVTNALKLVDDHRVDAALLDVNINGTYVFPVALKLRQLDVPFVFVTGYGAEGIPEMYQDCPIMTKPYDGQRLLREVAKLLASDGAC